VTTIAKYYLNSGKFKLF